MSVQSEKPVDISKVEDLFPEDMQLFILATFKDIELTQTKTSKRYKVIDSWITLNSERMDSRDDYETEGEEAEMLHFDKADREVMVAGW